MNWRIEYSKEAHKFITKHHTQDSVTQALKKFLTTMQGKRRNVDVKKLWGEWAGYYRIRKGKLRIIFKIETTEHVVFVERVDFRGNIYK